jgi:hypothetical protein
MQLMQKWTLALRKGSRADDEYSRVPALQSYSSGYSMSLLPPGCLCWSPVCQADSGEGKLMR